MARSTAKVQSELRGFGFSLVRQSVESVQWDALTADQVIETEGDLPQTVFSYQGDKTYKRRESREKAVKESVPGFWGGLEKVLCNISDCPLVLGERASIAD